MHRALELNQSQWLKPYIEFKIQEIIEAEINAHKGKKCCTNLWNMLGMGKT